MVRRKINGALTGMFVAGVLLLGCGPSLDDFPDYKPLRSSYPVRQTDGTYVSIEDRPTLQLLKKQQDAESPENATEKPVDVATTKPDIAIVPDSPVPGDILSFRSTNLVPVPAEATTRWFVRNDEASQATTLATTAVKKGTPVRLIVETPHWQIQATTTLQNRKPDFLGYATTMRNVNGFRIRVQGADADGDPIWLKAPALPEGIRVEGMELIVSGDAANVSRSLPLSLTDGEDSTGFIIDLR